MKVKGQHHDLAACSRQPLNSRQCVSHSQSVHLGKEQMFLLLQ